MRSAPLIAAIFVLASPATGSAESVRFDWTGTVSFAVPSLAAAGIVVGAPAVGHYRFESTTPDGDADPDRGFYDLALREWRVAVGLTDSTTTLPGFGSITAWLDFEGLADIYEVQVAPTVLIRLTDTEATALASDALPLLAPDLAEFEGAGLVQLDANTSNPIAIIDLDTLLRTTPIPMPGWSLATGALLILASALPARYRAPRSS